MKRVLTLILMLLILSDSALNEEEIALGDDVDLSGVQDALDHAGADMDAGEIFSFLLSGDAEILVSGIKARMKDAAFLSIKNTASAFSVLALSLLLVGIFQALMPDGGLSKGTGAHFAIRLMLLLSLMRMFLEAYALSEKSLGAISSLSDALTPVLVSLAALTGKTRMASLITPMGALASRLISHLLTNAGLRLTGVYALLSAVSGMGYMPLKRLTAFVKSFQKWLLGAMLGAYIALMSTGGLIAGAYDGVMIKSAKYAADSMIPIVGGEIAGTMESIQASAKLVRSAAGVTGLTALFSIAFPPFAASFVSYAALKLISAVSEVYVDDDILSAADVFSGAFSSLAAVTAAGAGVIFILIGATIGLGERALG
ncbi:MAG: hypothetical protein IJC48_03930 [Clostridia bacterium]|nr:hypothetical protein [Clostridia bacterium]